MTGTDSYSIAPATNATADGGAINWTEGQPPSSVNNSARQWMADERTSFNDLIWFQYGTGDQGAGNIAVPSVYLSSTQFTITGADVTLVYHVGRRVRAVGMSTGTIYGRISVTSYNSGNTKTTVTVVWDSGSLSNETLVVSLSQIPVTGAPMPYTLGPAAWTPTDGSGTGLSFTNVSASYSVNGNVVTINGHLTYPSTSDAAAAFLAGLPFPVPNQTYAAGGFIPIGCDKYVGGVAFIQAVPNTSTARFWFITSTTLTTLPNVNLSTVTMDFSFTYPLA